MKRKQFVVALLAIFALAAVTATGASAKALNVIIKKEGKTVAAKTAVKGGWAVGVETLEALSETGPYIYYGCESEGTMTLNGNDEKKVTATGDVGIPDEECGDLEIEEEASLAKMLKLKSSHRARFSSHSAKKKEKGPPPPPPILEDPKFTGGQVSEEEFTDKYAGKIDLSSPLKVTGTENGLTCTYESKTSFKSTWPAVEYPGNADLESEFDMKLAKGSPKGCEKELEAYAEAWLGPDYEELQAELGV